MKNALIFFAAVHFQLGLAFAAEVVSNTGGTAAGSLSPQSTLWLAQRFTTDDQEYEVTSVTFRGARHPAHSLAIYVYAHDAVGDAPVAGATGFGQMDASAVTTTLGEQIVPAMGTITLQPNTAYWIVIQPSDSNTAFWTQTSDLGNLSGPGTIENRRAFSSDGGASWTGSTNGSTNLMIAVDAETVPVELMRFEIK